MAETAAWLAVSADYVYRHAAELGALVLPAGRGGGRRGDGKRGRLRFDPASVRELLTARQRSVESQLDAASNGGESPTVRARPRRRRAGTGANSRRSLTPKGAAVDG